MFRFLAITWLNWIFQAIAPGIVGPTLLSDAIIPQIYESYVGVDNPELTAFFQSGVAVRNAMLDNCFTAGGTTVNVPFWNDLDPTQEPNYSTDNPNDVAVPNGITAGLMVARVANMNQGYSNADLVAQLAGSNPMQRVRDRFSTYWTRQWQRRVLQTCKGVLAANIANNASDMAVSFAIQTTTGQTAANLFNRANFVSAMATLGDAFGKIVAIAVHSVVYMRMVDNDDIQFIRPATVDPLIPLSTTGGQPYFLGKPVIVDDSMPVSVGTGNPSSLIYTSMLFGEGVIGYGEAPVPVPVEIYRRPDQANGGGMETLWERKSMIVHPFGHAFTSASVAGLTPTLAELALAANWQRVVPFRKSVPLAFLLTNG